MEQQESAITPTHAGRANLIPLTERSKERAKEIRSMGGKAIKGRFQLRQDRNCTSSCPMSGKCWAEPTSSQKFNGKCALAQFPPKIGERTIRAMMEGEIGFAMNMVELLSEIDAKSRADGSLEESRKLLGDYRSTFPILFGNKTKIEGMASQNVTFKDVEIKIMNLIKDPQQLEKKEEKD